MYTQPWVVSEEKPEGKTVFEGPLLVCISTVLVINLEMFPRGTVSKMKINKYIWEQL